MSFRLCVRAAKLLGFAGAAVLVLVMTGLNEAEARTATEKSARTEIWRGYGDAGYIISTKKQRLAKVHYKKRSFSSAVKKSGYKVKSASKATGKKYAALNYGLNDASPPK